MASQNALDSTQELLDAQAHLWNHIFSYVNCMSLRCAVQLGIPNIIHKHDKPITLSQLVDALPINKSKLDGLYRLMRILVHSKIFAMVKISEEEEAYSLTTASRLLLRDEPLSYATFAVAMADPIMIDPFYHLSDWFHDECSTPFVTKNGMNFWQFGGNDERWNQIFNKAMACDARFVGSMLVKECMHVFEGFQTMVDVAGGTGAVAKAIVDAFPGIKCIVLDLPQVVARLEGSKNLKFVSGDMFQFIPPTDVVFLKWIMHDWSDENCVRILKKCKETIIPSKNKGGKVIIVDMVVEEKKDHEATQTQLFFDIVLMADFSGKERTEKEWAMLFSSAGFNNYKINPVLGLTSVIEVFP